MTTDDSIKVLKISVVICTYNGGAFIKEQLESVLAQTRPADEIIVVDDGSTDNTIEIIESFLKTADTIKVFNNTSNLGFNKNFEKGMSLATGDVIAPCDQDDIWHEQKLELLLSGWKEDTPLIYCDSIKFKREVPTKIKAEPNINKIDGSNPFDLAIRNTVSGHAMLFKKELLHLAIPFDPAIYYDWWLAIVAMANGGISYLPQVLVFQREHSNNQTLSSNNSAKEQLKLYKNMLAQHLNKFENIPNLTAGQKQFFTKLSLLWKQSLSGRHKLQLFLFLMKNRHVLFKYKKRKVGFISHLKHSLRYSF